MKISYQKFNMLCFILLTILFERSVFCSDLLIISNVIPGIYGKVLDEKNKPVEFLNVSIHRKTDSSIVTGTSTNNAGNFEIKNISTGDYYLKISGVGYTTLIISKVNFKDEKSEINLGTLKVSEAVIQMNGKTITAERAPVEFHLDKQVINVSKNLNATGGTALDVLQMQPSIQTDPSGAVLLRGSANFTVQVDGRPSPMQGSDALRQIPSSMIENIEIITNPSAKYDAEGTAGIINIILKKQAFENINGILNAGIGSRNKYNSDLTTNYKTNNANYFIGINYRNNINYGYEHYFRRNSTDNTMENHDSEMEIENEREALSLRLTSDYNIGENSKLGFSGSYGNYRSYDHFMPHTTYWKDNTPTTYLSQFDDRKNPVKYYNGWVNYLTSFVPKTDEFSVDFFITKVDIPAEQLTREFSSDGFFKPLNTSPIKYELLNSSDRAEGRGRINYRYTFSAKNIIESGLQANFLTKNNDVNSRKYDWNKNEWTTNPTLTYEFKFYDYVYAGFLTYSDTLPWFDYKLGLRAEYSDRLLDPTTLSQKYEYKKLHLFPSVFFVTRISETEQMQLSYSRRISRPGDWQLNPYPSFSTSYQLSVGNPALRPELTDSYELNYQRNFKGYFLSVQTYLRKTNDGITQVARFRDNKLELTRENQNNATAIGAEISGYLSPVQFIRIDPAINLFDNRIKGATVNDEYQDSHMFTWNARMSFIMFFSEFTRIQLTGFYSAKNIGTFGVMEPMKQWAVSLRHEMFERALILTLQARNLFNDPRFLVNAKTVDGYGYLKARQETPQFSLNISFNFNNFKRSNRNPGEVQVNTGEGL